MSETSCASAPQLFDFLSAPPPLGVVASVSESGNTSSIPSDVPVEPSEPSIAYSDVVRGPVNPSEPTPVYRASNVSPRGKLSSPSVTPALRTVSSAIM